MHKQYRLFWIKQRLIHLSLFLLLLLGTTSTAMALTFTDGDFTDSDWTLTALTWPGYNLGSVSRSWQSSGGVGDSPFLQITTQTPNSGDLVAGYFIWGDAVYNPQTQGAITSVDYSEFRKQISGWGENQATGMALLQGGTYYQGGGDLTNVANWTS